MTLDRKVILKYQITVFVSPYEAVAVIKHKRNKTMSYQWSICLGIGNGKCCERAHGLGHFQFHSTHPLNIHDCLIGDARRHIPVCAFYKVPVYELIVHDFSPFQRYLLRPVQPPVAM